MKLQCGYLYAAKQQRNSILENYEKRFFVLYPFCGLQWFLNRPENIEVHDIMEVCGRYEDVTRGWVFGGNISLSEIDILESFLYYEDEIEMILYPFSLTLVCGESTMKLFLASQSLDITESWVNSVRLVCANLNLVKCFADANCFPFPFLEQGLSMDSLMLSNVKLSREILNAINNLIVLNSDTVTILLLKNCQIRDHHISLISNLIDPAVVRVLNLSENYITDAGAIELASVIANSRSLTSLDLSNNLIGDVGMEHICAALACCSDLTSLNISRNYLTDASVKPIAKHIAKYSSKIKLLDVSYNQLGDGCGGIIAILLYNKSGCLEQFDASFCGIRDAGIKELAAAIPHCRSIKFMNLKGLFAEPAVMIPLIESVAQHHKSYFDRPQHLSAKDSTSPDDSALAGLVVSLGSMTIQGHYIRSMSYKSAKSCLPYVEACTLLVDGCIRRRIQFLCGSYYSLQSQSNDDAFSRSLLNRSTSTLSNTRSALGSTNPVQFEKASIIVCLRFELSTDVTCAEDLIFRLAVLCRAHPNQFQILSMSSSRPSFLQENVVVVEARDDGEIDDQEYGQQNENKFADPAANGSMLCFATILLADPSHSQQLINKARLWPKHPGKLPTQVAQRILEEQNSTRFSLPAATQISLMLKDFATSSHPLLRSLRIRTVYIQQSVLQGAIDKHNNLLPGELKLAPISLESVNQNTAYVVCNSHVLNSQILGRGPLDNLLPILSPTEYQKLYDSVAANANRTYGGPPGAAGANLHGVDGQGVTNFEIWRKLALDEKLAGKYIRDVGGFDLFGDDEDDDKTDASSTIALKKFKENAIERALLKRERRLASESLIEAIRNLRKEGVIDSAEGKFWEGLLGNARYRDNVMAVKMLATYEFGKFRGIALRSAITEAMVQRDPTGLKIAIESLESNTLNGGLTVIYGKKLMSELTRLIHDWKIIVNSVKHYEYLALVESFLLECGRLGYRGTEMFAAVELRQTLMAQWAADRPIDVHDSIEVIRRRAYLSNLMISRDLERMEREYDEMRGLRDDNISTIPELQVCRQLLVVKSSVFKKLKKSLEAKNLEQVEDNIALASYHGFTGDAVAKGFAYIKENDSDTNAALRPLLRAIRTFNIPQVYDALQELYRIGWANPLLRPELVQQIIDRRALTLRIDADRTNLIRTVIQIHGGFHSTPFEIARVYQRAKCTPSLWNNPLLESQFKVLEKKLKKSAYPFIQEGEILRQIENKDIEALEILLSGKGYGKLVVNAPTPELLAVWTERLQQVCSDHNGPNGYEGDVIMAGTMEKAARSDSGTLRGWRKRYFILQGSMLTYLTAAGGEKKGAVRVKGGSLRALDPSECGGRQYCLELQEGRDLSILDPELITSAKKIVDAARKEILEYEMMTAMDNNDFQELYSLTNRAKFLGLRIDFQLDTVVTGFLREVDMRNAKSSVIRSLQVLPKAQLEGELKKVEQSHLDTMNPAVVDLIRYTQMTDLQVGLRRLQAYLSSFSLEAFESNGFRKLYSFFSRFDIKKFGVTDRRMLIAMMLQHNGVGVSLNYFTGEPLAYLDRMLKHALTCCSHFHTETEPMQLGRFFISLASRSQLGHDSSGNGIVVRAEKRQDFNAFLDDFKTSGHLNPLYSIDKFGLLNLANDSSGGGILSSIGLRRPTAVTAKGQSDAVALLTFSANPLSKVLVRFFNSSNTKEKVNAEGISQTEILRLFDALQVVMGDKPLSSIQSSRSAYKSSLITGKHADEIDVAMELIRSGMRFNSLVDELYLQVCKQLTGNYTRKSILAGWTLLSLYLHYFAPSMHLLPYLQNFVQQNLKNLSINLYCSPEALSSGMDGPEESGMTSTELQKLRADKFFSVCNLMAYCNSLLSTIELATSRKVARKQSSDSDEPEDRGTSPVNTPINFAPKELQRSDVELALRRTPFYVDVITMTGSKYLLLVKYGDITTPFSVMARIFEKYSGWSVFTLLQSLRPLRTDSSDSVDSSDFQLLRSFYCNIFKGFGLYFHVDVSPVDESDSTEAEKVEEEQPAAMQLIPIQPEERQYIDFSYDLLWDMITLARELVSTQSQASAAGSTSSGVDENLQNTILGNFIIRRRVALCTERYSDQLSLFSDLVATQDVLGLEDLWSTWLSSLSQTLPSEYARIDFQFAEECRYVNSGLYGSPPCSDTRLYLLAIQMALSWEDFLPNEWGDISYDGSNADDREILTGADLSVRPIHRFHVPPISCSQASYTNDSHSDHQGVATRRQSQAANLARKTILASGYRNTLINLKVQNSNDSGFDLENAQSTVHESTIDNGDASLEHDSDEKSIDNEAKADDSDGDYSGEEVVSLYSSEDYDEHTDPDEYQKPPKHPITSFERLSDLDLEEISHKLRLMGVDFAALEEEFDDSEAGSDTFPRSCLRKLVDKVISLHKIALENDISTSSPRFRYLLKRVYLDLVKSWPLFGTHFSLGKVVDASLLEPDPRIVSASSAPAAMMPSVPIGESMLIVFSANGILFLDPSEWTVVFQGVLFDIEGIAAGPLEDVEQDENESFDSVLNLTVNGLKLTLHTTSAGELQSIAEANAMHSLANGNFPLGTGCPHHHPTDGFDNHAACRQGFIAFTRMFPFLEPPPMPPVLVRAPNFFYPPRSTREILAEERMKEELLEEAVAKLAAEAQAEKNQMKLEEGRQAVHNFDKEYGSDNSDDEKHRDKHENRGVNKRRMTRRREQNNRMTMGVNSEQNLKLQIAASVCGVPSRKSRIEHVAPDPPLRRGGRLKLDAYDRVRIEDTPVIEVPAVTNLAALRPVSLVWPGIMSPAITNFKKSLQADAQAKFAQRQLQIQQLLSEGLSIDSPLVAEKLKRTSVWTNQSSSDTNWSVAAVTYADRYIDKESAVYDSIDLIGLAGDEYEPTGSLPTNDYYPCMGVLNHLKRKKKSKRTIEEQVTLGEDPFAIATDETIRPIAEPEPKEDVLVSDQMSPETTTDFAAGGY